MMILLGLALAAQMAPQATDTLPAAPMPAKVRSVRPKMICTEEGDTGSRLGGKRVCRTAEQMRLQREENRDAVERAQRAIPVRQGS